jgi:hypothetical protein
MFPIHFQIPTIALRPFIQFYTQVEVSLRDPHDYDCLIRSLTEQNLSSGRRANRKELNYFLFADHKPELNPKPGEYRESPRESQNSQFCDHVCACWAN